MVVYLWTASWSFKFGNSVRDPEFPILRWRVRRLPEQRTNRAKPKKNHTEEENKYKLENLFTAPNPK